jgi:hypothetical protein
MDTPETPLLPRLGRKKLKRLGSLSENPIPGTAKVRLNVARLSDLDLVSACKCHAEAAHDNPLFPDLQPSEEDYQFLIDDFSGSVTEIAALKLQLDAAYQRRDVKRGALEAGTRTRISYVQVRSNSESTAIMSGGFNTQKTPSPIGYLDPPINLFVTLNHEAGSMEVTWNAVKKTRGYLLQYAEGKRGDETPNWILKVATKPKLILTGMKLGTSYLFRAATLGGKGGQSSWSPVVVRVAG